MAAGSLLRRVEASPMTVLRTSAEIGMGAVYLVGAVFNAAWTLGHTAEFFGGFADGAWLGPSRSLVRDVIIPNARMVTIVLIAFQVTVGVLILTRGDLVVPALLVGGVFALAAALISSPGGTAGNLLLAGIQFALAAAR